jgi:hypothetical protein
MVIQSPGRTKVSHSCPPVVLLLLDADGEAVGVEEMVAVGVVVGVGVLEGVLVGAEVWVGVGGMLLDVVV